MHIGRHGNVLRTVISVLASYGLVRWIVIQQIPAMNGKLIGVLIVYWWRWRWKSVASERSGQFQSNFRAVSEFQSNFRAVSDQFLEQFQSSFRAVSEGF